MVEELRKVKYNDLEDKVYWMELTYAENVDIKTSNVLLDQLMDIHCYPRYIKSLKLTWYWSLYFLKK